MYRPIPCMYIYILRMYVCICIICVQKQYVKKCYYSIETKSTKDLLSECVKTTYDT